MSGGCTIRAYEPRDYDRASTVHTAALRASPVPYREGGPPDSEFETTVDAATDGDACLLVGLVDGTLVALGGLKPRDASSGVVTAMRVHPDHQGEGYGAAILDALEREGRERDHETLVRYTDARREAARGLYERHDWTRVDSASYGPNAEVVRYRKRFRAE
ncbi:GNAT family N-acetyltransferase [Halorientalis pallida]|uniref:GNAT family N-acetyltransferase n=1 Tax=Halorientalis pallida TaxID=2479928 RepID=A0A498KSB2_9EURY|nr:GNAT family N-acetyltransferase [Halorientalis pallida]RXK47408.1 GNAT family N-acetyltransferase [Halorientalis pallida]